MLTNVKAGGITCVKPLCIENKAGGLGAEPQPPEANGGSEAKPPTLRRSNSFFRKIRIFRQSL